MKDLQKLSKQELIEEIENLRKIKDLKSGYNDTEELLQESEQRFSMLMKQSPSVIEIYGPDGLQLSVNEAYEKLWDFPASTTVNKFNVLKSKEVKETGLLEYINRAYAGELVIVPEYKFNPTGQTEAQGLGRVRWLSTKIFPLKNRSGEVRNIVITHEDVSDRKLVEENLQKSEELFRVLYHNSPDMYVSVSPENGNILLCNNTFLNKTGYVKDEIIGASIFKVYHNDCLIEAKSAFQEFVKTGFVKDKELILKRKNGTKIDVSLNVLAVRDEAGEIRYSMSTWRDITEQKQAEQALKQSEERFDLAVKGSKDAIWDWDNLESDEYWWSDRLYEILGYKPGEVEARISNWQKWMHPDDSGIVIDVLNKHFEEKLPYQVEFRMQTKGGDYIWVAVSGESIRDNNGKPIRMAGSLSDITDRKRTKLALEERNVYIESIMEHMPIGFAVNAMDDGDVKYMNKRFEEIYGWSRDVLTNTSIFFDKVFPEPEYREKTKSQIIADMQSGDRNRMNWKDLKIVTNTGEERFVHAFNIPLSDQNLMISTVQDTTQRKLAEDEVQKHQGHLEELVRERTKNLEEKNKELENFNKLFVDREFRIKELKEKIKELKNSIEK